MATAELHPVDRSRPMTGEEKKVILASSLGTVFEWYDFYLYGSLAAIIGAQFFTSFPEATRNIFALLGFAAPGAPQVTSSQHAPPPWKSIITRSLRPPRTKKR